MASRPSSTNGTHFPTTTTTTPSLQSPTSRDPTIRHAGRAHIRGRIRRVWRPRYLELCDSGMVRYYELPPTADITLPSDSDWDHVHMIPKDTLVVFYARIIDVTTLRDLHVGLPRGSFGFLFRGQRLVMTQDFFFTSSSTHQCHPPEPIQPRDFFCAVSSLEEAQTWVIALQWAASVWKHAPIPNSPTDAGYGVVTTSTTTAAGISSNNATAMFHDPVTRTTGRSLPTSHHPPEEERVGSHKQQEQLAASNDSAKKLMNEKRQKKSGRIVVTKVQHCRLVRLHGLQWEVAFEVRLLLLQQQQQQPNIREGDGDGMSDTTTHTSNITQRRMEERRVLKTPQDLERFLFQLEQEIRDNALLVDWIHKLRDQVRKLPRLSSTKNTTTFCSAHDKQLTKSILLLDGILRSLAMDASIVNSHAMKNCFFMALEENNNNNNSSSTSLPLPALTTTKYLRPWWSVYVHCHGGSSSRQNNGLVYRNTQSLPMLTSTDDFVKNWLSAPESSTTYNQKNDKAILLDGPLLWFFISRPWIFVSGLGIVLAAVALPLVQVCHHVGMISVRLRLDALVFSWIAAALCGRYFGNRRSSSSKPIAKSHHHKRPKNSATTRPVTKVSPSTTPPTTSANTCVEDLSSGEASDDSGVDGGDLEYLADEEGEVEETTTAEEGCNLSSPLPLYPSNGGESCWSIPNHDIFRVRGPTYLDDRVKIPSGPSPFTCRGVDVWLTDNPERHIARHPDVLGGKLLEMDTFLVNFLLPFGNFVSYFSIPPIEDFPSKEVASVWTKFLKGDQQYRDARLKMLPIVVDGPWIVKAAVGNGTAPALLGKVIPLQYFFQDPSPTTAGVYEVDVIITASSIAKGILSVVKGHTKSLTLAFAFIIEAAEKEELPETVLCSFQVHALHLEDCPRLPHSSNSNQGDESGSVM
jgi:hypothetical protein